MNLHEYLKRQLGQLKTVKHHHFLRSLFKWIKQLTVLGVQKRKSRWLFLNLWDCFSAMSLKFSYEEYRESWKTDTLKLPFVSFSQSYNLSTGKCSRTFPNHLKISSKVRSSGKPISWFIDYLFNASFFILSNVRTGWLQRTCISWERQPTYGLVSNHPFGSVAWM